MSKLNINIAVVTFPSRDLNIQHWFFLVSFNTCRRPYLMPISKLVIYLTQKLYPSSVSFTRRTVPCWLTPIPLMKKYKI